MRSADTFVFALRALRAYPTRTLLMLLAMAIGVAAVVALTALGDGARRYVTGEFASLGTHLLIVLPGRSETTGAAALSLGGREREAMVPGTTAEFLDVRSLTMAQGRLLPADDWSRAQSVCVRGQKLREELFATTPAAGAWVRRRGHRLGHWPTGQLVDRPRLSASCRRRTGLGDHRRRGRSARHRRIVCGATGAARSTA